MSKPHIFVSSTYVDLKDLRESLRKYLSEAGYEPIVHEQGEVFYAHTRPLDASCYSEVKQSDIFVLVIGGRYGSSESTAKKSIAAKSAAIKKYNSVVRSEYQTAHTAKIPIFIFVNADVLAEFKTFQRNKNSHTINYAHVDNVQIFELISDIYAERENNPLFPFRQVNDIIEHLKKQFAGMIKEHVTESRESSQLHQELRVNCFKLFYFRRLKDLSFPCLSDLSGVPQSELERLEILNKKVGRLGPNSFALAEGGVIAKIERALECPGVLALGKQDDFRADYMMYYDLYKGKRRKSGKPGGVADLPLAYRTKAVVFDFDGTLTKSADDLTTWEVIWQFLGYSINDCALLHGRFRKKEFNHEKWCNITRDRFREKGLNESHLAMIANRIELVKGTAETIMELKRRGIKLYILSGSIRQIIKVVLKDLWGEFEHIKANDMHFDSLGLLSNIQGTQFDFEGKAKFLSEVIEENNLRPYDVLFVGNSGNDVWAIQSGARALCVNPKLTDPDDTAHWTASISKLDSLLEIMKFISPDD
jgi:HAD superfamily phosphoserine phosphatase-like hydrolase